MQFHVVSTNFGVHTVRMLHPTRPTSVAAAGAITLLLATSSCITSCAASERSPSVEPVVVHAGDADSTVPGAASPRDPADPDAVGASTTTSPSGAVAGAAQGGDLQRAVDAALARYDEVLSELSRDPTGAPPPGSAARARWDAAVEPDSVLSTELLARIQQRVSQERAVVEPGPDGISFRHISTDLTTAPPDEVAFEWCGWSPGIGRSIDTGVVVDDVVAHTTGTGRIRRSADGWRVAALDQDEIELLPAGSGDPCPARSASEDTPR